tara:strand:+ start:274062 stop:274676 length:615 start_codon:yes stop_codon:yes gene_type:complete
MLSEHLRELCFHNLEQKSWSSHLNVLSEGECSNLIEYIDFHLEQENFKNALIGNGLKLQEDTKIRSSKIAWINHWDARPELMQIQNTLENFRTSLNKYFFLALKRFETQFAFYEKGDFYKKHLDQLKETRHRQITLILYLNNCPLGGELVVYNKNNRNKVDAIIKPQAGQMVCFLSSQIFHEVLPTNLPRYSMTTWFRDDLIVF